MFAGLSWWFSTRSTSGNVCGSVKSGIVALTLPTLPSTVSVYIETLKQFGRRNRISRRNSIVLARGRLRISLERIERRDFWPNITWHDFEVISPAMKGSGGAVQVRQHRILNNVNPYLRPFKSPFRVSEPQVYEKCSTTFRPLFHNLRKQFDGTVSETH